MSEKQAPYWTVPSLEYIYLKDSYVLDVEVHIRRVVFRLDLVLTEKHADYTPPKPGEQYCYRHAQLIFEDVREVDWRMSASPPNVIRMEKWTTATSSRSPLAQNAPS